MSFLGVRFMSDTTFTVFVLSKKLFPVTIKKFELVRGKLGLSFLVHNLNDVHGLMVRVNGELVATARLMS